MSTDRKVRHQLGNSPYHLRLSLLLSLLLHGALFIGLEICWRWIVSHPLSLEPDALLPVKLVEVPPDKVATTPPPNAKHLSTSNSRAGGKAGRKLPVVRGASNATPLLSSPPSSVQSKPSTPHPSRPSQESQQSQIALPQNSPSPTSESENFSPLAESKLNVPLEAAPTHTTLDDRPRSSSPEAITEPKSKPHSQPPPPDRSLLDSLMKLANRESEQQIHPPPTSLPTAPTRPESKPRSQSPHHDPNLIESLANLAKHPLVSESQTHPPELKRPVVANSQPTNPPQATVQPRLKVRSQPPLQQNAAPEVANRVVRARPPSVGERKTHTPRLDRLALGSKPSISQPAASHSSKPKSNLQHLAGTGASLLGGPITLASREFRSDRTNDPSGAARLATDPEGVDARRNVNLGPYLEKLLQQVEKQWRHEMTNSSRQTILAFTVNRTGQVSDLRILKRSGSTRIDRAALEAIQQAAPFAPLPESYPWNEFYIHFVFNVDVYGDLELKN